MVDFWGAGATRGEEPCTSTRGLGELFDADLGAIVGYLASRVYFDIAIIS